jgi:hypothetical protein
MTTFEATFVVHELQHLYDHGICENPLVESDMTPFHSEKSALFSEVAFLEYSQAGQIEKRMWLESNLFYPVMMMKAEIECRHSGEFINTIFAKICEKHGLLPFPLSPLFECQLPFQFATYCSAVVDLVPEWKQYISTTGQNL